MFLFARAEGPFFALSKSDVFAVREWEASEKLLASHEECAGEGVLTGV